MNIPSDLPFNTLSKNNSHYSVIMPQHPQLSDEALGFIQNVQISAKTNNVNQQNHQNFAYRLGQYSGTKLNLLLYSQTASINESNVYLN